MRERRTRRGFTLIEIIVSIGIIGTLAAIMIPAFNRQRDTQNANQTAWEIRSKCLEAAAFCVRRECWAIITISNNSYNINYVDAANAAISNSHPYKLQVEGSAGIVAGTGTLVYSPRGWVQTSGAPAVTSMAGSEPNTDPVNGVNYYISVASGTGLYTYTVRCYLNGRTVVI